MIKTAKLISANISRRRITIGLLILVFSGWMLFDRLLTWQQTITYKYFVDKPAKYNTERAQNIALSIYRSFNQEVPDPSPETVRNFLKKYNKIPFLTVNFVEIFPDGAARPVNGAITQKEILNADYAYPINGKNGAPAGSLIIYGINKEYETGMREYDRMTRMTRALFITLIGLLSSLLIAQEYLYKMRQAKKVAEYDAMHDGLTNLYTQKYFKLLLEREFVRGRRYKRPMSLIIADIDYFKKFNDEFGHLMGDSILKEMGKVMSLSFRSSDVVSRYGGDEFAVLLPETDLKGAASLAKRLQRLTSELLLISEPVKTSSKDKPPKKIIITLSMGIAHLDTQEDFKPEYLIAQADQALYESKRRGRNHITLYRGTENYFEEAA